MEAVLVENLRSCSILRNSWSNLLTLHSRLRWRQSKIYRALPHQLLQEVDILDILRIQRTNRVAGTVENTASRGPDSVSGTIIVVCCTYQAPSGLAVARELIWLYGVSQRSLCVLGEHEHEYE